MMSALSSQLASGNFPDYGAIFMANNFTREECFERRLFGLPFNFADFVKKVKKGMLLFLFDFQDRRLHGVFEARTNGALNVIPDAYKSAKMKFPAQVRFNVVWRCHPLPEHVFHDAIKENLYQRHKFNFGLSREQVRRLLLLFEVTKLEVSRPRMLERHERHNQKLHPACPRHPRSSENPRSSGEQNSSPERVDDQTSPVGILDVCGHTPLVSVADSMPKKVASLVVCDLEMTPDLEDYIPLPSIDPDEFEDHLPADLQWETNSSALRPFLDFGGDSVLTPAICFSKPQDIDTYEQIDESCRYQIQGSDSQNPDAGSCCSERKTCLKKKDDKKADHICAYPIHGLYSDRREEGTSVFRRLAGLPKVVLDGSNCEPGSLEPILNSLDKKHKMWQNKASKTDCSYLSDGALGGKVSVFSRLGDDSGYAVGSTQRDKASVRAKKRRNEADISVFSRLGDDSGYAVGRTQRDKASVRAKKRRNEVDVLPHHKLNRKIFSGVEVRGIETKDRGTGELAGKQQKRRRLCGKHVGKSSTETETLKEAAPGEDHSLGSPASTVNSGSTEAAEDPIKKLLKQYQEYLFRSSGIKEITEEISDNGVQVQYIS